MALPVCPPRQLKTPGIVGSKDSCLKIKRRAENWELEIGALSLETLRQAKQQNVTILPVPPELYSGAVNEIKMNFDIVTKKGA